MQGFVILKEIRTFLEPKFNVLCRLFRFKGSSYYADFLKAFFCASKISDINKMHTDDY